jgi:hypothetical protein
VNARITEINNRNAKEASDAARAGGDTSQGEFIPVQNTPPVIPASFMTPSSDQTAAFTGETQEAPPVIEEEQATSTATTTEDVNQTEVETVPQEEVIESLSEPAVE